MVGISRIRVKVPWSESNNLKLYLYSCHCCFLRWTRDPIHFRQDTQLALLKIYLKHPDGVLLLSKFLNKKIKRSPLYSNKIGLTVTWKQIGAENVCLIKSDEYFSKFPFRQNLFKRWMNTMSKVVIFNNSLKIGFWYHKRATDSC